MFARILVPTDFSSSANKTLKTAYAHYPQAEVQLLHILSPQRVAAYYSDTLTSPVDAAQARKALEKEALANLREVARPCDTCTTVVGQPVEAILQQAQAWQADLIVMGTHGRTGLAHFLNGSVAEAVVRHARMPVLVVHGDDHTAS
jgi:nucleotide-binding universal stress UspA family protein